MNPIVRVAQGQLQGVRETNINGTDFIAYRGIPYAKQPIGELRFKDPEPVEPWFDVKDATKYGDACAQRDWITEKILGSDDCLYLNIYTTTLTPALPRAVMFWIHGGSFLSGSGDDQRWGPDYFIEKDIVLVTINYRLGILGFLNIEDDEAPGNQGLKDQVEALKWVRQNIVNFGGDPNNVTIFGQSAGGASVHYLTISPLAQGLFHKAIIQSGVAINSWASTPYEPVEVLQRLAQILKKDIAEPKKIVDYLRTLDSHHLIELEYQIDTKKEKILFIHGLLPSVDKNAKNPFLPIPLEEAVKAAVKVPCIYGYVSHEGICIAPYLSAEMLDIIDANPETLLIHPNIESYLNKKNITGVDIKKIFFGEEKISSININKLVDMMGVLHVIIGIHAALELQSNNSPNTPTYLYKFDYNLKNSLKKKLMKTNLQGTSHSDELEFLFYPKLYRNYRIEPPASDSIEHRLIQTFTEFWSSFAKTGNPIPQTGALATVVWKTIDNANEFNCLNITEKLTISKEVNIMHKLSESMKTKKADI